MKRRSRLVRWLTIAAALALLASAALWMGRTQVLSGVGHWLDVGEQPLAVDYVMPLAGDHNSRPFVAAELYRAGLTPKILVPRPGQSQAVREGRELAHEEICRRVLLKLGVRADDIVMLDGENRSTFDEAERLRVFLAGADPKVVAVVTNDLHTRRTRWTFRRALDGTPHQLHFIAAPSLECNADNWWHCEQGAVAYPSELMKMLFYWCYYGPGLFWAGGSLLVAGVIITGTWLKFDPTRSSTRSAAG